MVTPVPNVFSSRTLVITFVAQTSPSLLRTPSMLTPVSGVFSTIASVITVSVVTVPSLLRTPSMLTPESSVFSETLSVNTLSLAQTSSAVNTSVVKVFVVKFPIKAFPGITISAHGSRISFCLTTILSAPKLEFPTFF